MMLTDQLIEERQALC